MIFRLYATGGMLAAFLVACAPSPMEPAYPLSATPQEAFRQSPPQLPPPPPFELPAIVTKTLPNGLTVYLVKKPQANVVALLYVTKSGGENGPLKTAGLAWFTGDVLLRGTKSEAPWESHLLRRHGLYPRVGVQRDHARLSLTAPAHRYEEALGLLARAVREPSFAPEHVEQARQEGIRGAKSTWATPNDRAWLQARRLLHGKGSRLALPAWGSEENIRAFTRDQLVDFHRQSWGPRDAAFVVVGDVDEERFFELVEEHFATFSSPAAEPPAGAKQVPESPFEQPRILGIQSRAERATIILYDHGPAKNHEDSVGYSFLSTALGGFFGSQLNLSLREGYGMSYGVNATYIAHASRGELGLMTHVDQRGISTALYSIVSALHRLKTEGPTEEEMVAARAIEGAYQVDRFETVGATARAVSEAFVLGEQPEVFLAWDEKIRTITREEVKAVARRWLRPEKAPMVVVGQAHLVATALKTSRLGTVGFEKGLVHSLKGPPKVLPSGN